MSTQIDIRRHELLQAKDALKTFIRSPNGKDVIEFLYSISGCVPIMSTTPEKTAYNIGAYELIKQIQKLGVEK